MAVNLVYIITHLGTWIFGGEEKRIVYKCINHTT